MQDFFVYNNTKLYNFLRIVFFFGKCHTPAAPPRTGKHPPLTADGRPETTASDGRCCVRLPRKVP